MKRISPYRLYLMCVFSFMLVGCVNKDYDLDNISENIILKDISLVTPLGSIEINLGELIDQYKVENLVVDGNLLYIEYKDTMIISPIQQVQVSGNSTANQHMLPPSTGTQFTMDAKYTLKVNSPSFQTRIDSIRLKKSRMKLTINSALPDSVWLSVQFPGSRIISDSQPVKFNVKPGLNTFYIDLKEQSVVKINKNLWSYSFDMKYVLDVPASTTLNTGDIQINPVFESFNPGILWGNFPDMNTLKAEGEFEMDIMKNILTEGSVLYLTNPSITCHMNNYNGFDTDFNIDYFKSKNKDMSETVADFKGSPSFKFTLERSLWPGMYKTSTMTFDKDNGSLNRLLTTNLTGLSFGFSFDSKADENDNQFIFLDKNIDMLVDIRIPVSLDKGSMFLTRDTFEVDLSEITKKADLKDILLKIDYVNKLPLKAQIEVEFLDAEKNIIRSIPKKKYSIASPEVNSQGYATKEANGQLDIQFAQSKLSAIENVKFIEIGTTTSGCDALTPVTFTTNDFIRLRANLYVKGNFNFTSK